MSKEQVEQELRETLKSARQADGYMITIHRRNGDKLTHWSGTVDYKNEDIERGLFSVLDARHA